MPPSTFFHLTNVHQPCRSCHLLKKAFPSAPVDLASVSSGLSYSPEHHRFVVEVCLLPSVPDTRSLDIIAVAEW